MVNGNFRHKLFYNVFMIYNEVIGQSIQSSDFVNACLYAQSLNVLRCKLSGYKTTAPNKLAVIK